MTNLITHTLDAGITGASGILGAFTAPIKDTLKYACPKIFAIISGQHELSESNNELQNTIVPLAIMKSIQEETKKILDCANREDNFKIFTSLSASFGGTSSRLGSIVTMPLCELKDRDFNTTVEIEEEETLDTLSENLYRFSNNEFRFQVARSTHLMQYSIFKLISRIAIVALSIFILFTPLNIVGGLVVFLSAAILYNLTDRVVEIQADAKGIEVLTKRFIAEGFSDDDAKQNAIHSALNTINKMKLRNIEKRKNGLFSKIVYNNNGDNRFDFTSSSFTKRISKINKIKIEFLKNLDPYKI
jgi:hypothetical protein